MSMYSQSFFGTGQSSREIENQEYFIQKVKKQKQKVQLIANQFKQQESVLENQQKKIEFLNHQNALLKSENDRFHQKQQNYIFELADKHQIIQQLESKINYILSQAHKLQEERELKKQQLKIQELKYQERGQNYLKNFNYFKQEITKLSKEIGLIREKFKQKQRQVLELHQCIQLASTTISKLQAQLARSKKSIEYHTKESSIRSSQYQSQILSLTKDVQNLKNKLASQQKIVIDLQAQGSHQKSKIEEFQNVVNEKQQIIEKQNLNLQKCVKEMQCLQSDLIQRDQIIERLNNKIKQHKKAQAIKKQLYHLREQQSSNLDLLISELRLKSK